MSNILPGRAAARSWKLLQAQRSSAPSPASRPAPPGKGAKSEEKPGDGAGTIQARGIGTSPRCQGEGREGRMLRGTVGNSQEAQVGGGSSGPPLEQGWKPDPGCVLPEAAYFGREACWQSAWCEELLTPGNRTALIGSQPCLAGQRCLASARGKICPSTTRTGSPAPESAT